MKKPRDAKAVLYRGVESSFFDLQKLTFFGCASRRIVQAIQGGLDPSKINFDWL
jgi:hypothetical protein